MELVGPDVDEAHAELIAERAAWAAIRQHQADGIAAVRSAVRDEIQAYFREQQITPDHWLYLRLELAERRETWGTIRKTAIGIILAAALAFGGNALWESAAAKILAADNSRSGGNIRAQGPTPESPR